MRTRKFLIIAALSTMLTAPLAQAAQTTFPEKPIRLVIGSAPGSGPDIISRALADRLFGAWGQRVVVDSRPGVAGVLSADLVLHAPADGYTWMMLTSQLLVATAVFPNVKFNLEKDFASLSLIGTTSFVLVANPEIPAKSIKELIEFAKKTPLKYGSAGTGASEHLSGVLFTKLTGTDMLHIPYKGVAEAMAATMGKEVNLTYGVVPAVLGAVQSGRVRALGVTGLARAIAAPEVPTIAESGLPGYDAPQWYGLLTTAGTPAAVIDRLHRETARVLALADMKQRLEADGTRVVAGTPAEFSRYLKNEIDKWAGVIRSAGIKPE
jgi:tripartite-type tricarboxylate transporter receptor subunit TctC